MTLKLLDRLMNRHRPEPKSEPEPEDPTQLRYVYRVVVDAERDDKLLVRDEPVTIDAEVPFRGRAVIVDRIEEIHEKDAAGGDLGERLESKPDVQIARTLICREVVPVTD
jgi:hypothetical protein